MAIPLLTSTRNPRVRAAAELRGRRRRDETRLTLVDGVRELARALDGGAQVTDLFAVADAGPLAREVIRRAAAAGATIVTAEPRVIEHLAYGERSEGLVAVVRVPTIALRDIPLPADPLLVVVEGVEKPGNLGAVLRSADAAAASAVVAADAGTDLFNPNAIRASLGTVFALPVAAATSEVVRAWLRDAGVGIVAARVDGDVHYADADLRGPTAIVLGSEARGLTPTWSGVDVRSVRIPMLGVADSLNVSITAAVLLFEARRQRTMEADGPEARPVQPDPAS